MLLLVAALPPRHLFPQKNRINNSIKQNTIEQRIQVEPFLERATDDGWIDRDEKMRALVVVVRLMRRRKKLRSVSLGVLSAPRLDNIADIQHVTYRKSALFHVGISIFLLGKFSKKKKPIFSFFSIRVPFSIYFHVINFFL